MDTSAVLVIENGTLIDGNGNEPVSDATVVISGNQIAAVERGPQVPGANGPPDEVTRIDARGLWIMPGLIDAHCHITYGESRTQEEQDLYTSVESRTLRAAWNITRVLRAGVTAISQPGGSYNIGVAIRDAIKEGRLPGPRMWTAGRYLTTSNGLVDFYPDSVGVPDGAIGILTNTTAEMLSEVRHQVKAGVDFIKLADSPFGEFQAFRDEELVAITELAHQLGRKVTIHARGPNEARAAVRAKVDWIMHANIMDDATIEEMAEAEITLVPTLTLLANWADFGHLVGVPPSYIAGARQLLEATRDTLHRAHRAGVRLAAGTDTGFAVTPYGEWHARELELLMDYAGLSALEAISAGTRNGALTVGLEDQLGVVEPGKLADLLLLDADPVADIRVLQDRSHIRAVIKDGQLQQFDPDTKDSWPHDRSLTISTEELTYEKVRQSRDAMATA